MSTPSDMPTVDPKIVARVKVLIQEYPGIDLPWIARSISAQHYSTVESVIFWLLANEHVREVIPRKPPAHSALAWNCDEEHGEEFIE